MLNNFFFSFRDLKKQHKRFKLYHIYPLPQTAGMLCSLIVLKYLKTLFCRHDKQNNITYISVTNSPY